MLLQFIRGTFQQKPQMFFCFSCLIDFLRSRAEENATYAADYSLYIQTIGISGPVSSPRGGFGGLSLPDYAPSPHKVKYETL